MSTSVRQHLANFHREAEQHHLTMSKHHDALATAMHGLAKSFSKAAKDDENEHSKKFSALARAHEGAVAEHQRLAEFHGEQKEACAKAAEGDLAKLVPSSVSRITPDNPQFRVVPRAGQRPIADAATVPLEFQRLFKVDEDDEMNSLA